MFVNNLPNAVRSSFYAVHLVVIFIVDWYRDVRNLDANYRSLAVGLRNYSEFTVTVDQEFGCLRRRPMYFLYIDL